MHKTAICALVAVVGVGLSLGACGAVVSTAAGGLGAVPGAGSGPGTTALQVGSPAGPAVPAVPAAWEAIDRAAAMAECPGLDWSLLAAIGRVESDSGRSALPGVWSGANAAGAEGPMQFEPTTFARYGVVAPGGASPPSPYDPADAVYTAARLVCADGAAAPGGAARAVWDYNHDTTYVQTVLVLAAALGTDPALGTRPATALAFAAAQLGVPYRWGGTGPGGYDCSGLVQAAERAAGVPFPRVAQAQFDAGPAVAPGTPVRPGDLVFFGGSATDVTHVAIVVGDGTMIDAPHTGTVVQVAPMPASPGDRWGTEVLVGATRPAK